MPISLLDKLHDIPHVFIDFETTGVCCEWGDRVIEIGLVRVEGGRRVAEVSQLVDPERHINSRITFITGITPAMCAGQPTFEQAIPKLLEVMSGAIVLGHNVRFDLSFLCAEFRRAGLDICRSLNHAHVIDTVRIARRHFGRGGNGLQRLAPRLGIQPTGAHRALADAQTTHLIFEKLIEPHGGWQMCLADAIRRQGGVMGLLPATPRPARQRRLEAILPDPH